MARTSMVLLIAGCVMLAAVIVQAEKYSFSFYEHDTAGNEIESFGPKDANDVVGKGFIYTNMATKTEDLYSEEYATVSGLYFYSNQMTVNEISTIQFRDIGEKGGRFADAELHIRGLWNMKLMDSSDEENQQLAIVGGSYGLANAYGTLSYTKVPSADAWYVQGSFEIDDCSKV